MDNAGRVSRLGGRWLGAALIAFALQSPLLARAEGEATDLPSRVGRVSESAGEMFLATQDRAGEWAPIGLNYPITSGDNLWVAADARAEIDLGGAQLRVAGDSNLQVTTLDDHELALFVAAGKVILRLQSLDPGDVARIDTPYTQIQIDRPGRYRVDVLPQLEQTIVLVREGEADVRFGGGMQQTLPGQAVTVRGVDAVNIAIQNGFGSDGFDAWSATRDQRYDSTRGPAYVSREMVGARDLDDYGTWETASAYGAVWFPTTVAVGWAPYRFGSWAWVDPWGWTWVDDAPWGYAPFHYGRWVWFSGRWGWCPGRFVARPVWGPAFVGWFGGPGWGAPGGPIYGWVPLGWGEPFMPWWGRCSARCWHQYNLPYAVAMAGPPANPPARYANASVPGAITAVPGSVLAGRRSVAPNLISAPSPPGSAPPVLAGAPAVRPLPMRTSPRPGLAATPAPAGTRYPTLNRDYPPGPLQGSRVLTPSTAPDASPPRRVAAPPVPTPERGGRIVSAPPPREPRALAPSTPAAPIAAPPVYGGVSGGRGAYTGLAPTPGPKAPAPAIDRGLPLPASLQPVAPYAIPAQAVPSAGTPVAAREPGVHPGQAAKPVAAPATPGSGANTVVTK